MPFRVRRRWPISCGSATRWSGWAILVLLGVGPTIGGFGLYLVSLAYLPATVTNLIGTLEPAFTAMWAFLLFREQLTVIQLTGALLVIASVVLLRVVRHPGSCARAGLRCFRLMQNPITAALPQT